MGLVLSRSFPTLPTFPVKKIYKKGVMSGDSSPYDDREDHLLWDQTSPTVKGTTFMRVVPTKLGGWTVVT